MPPPTVGDAWLAGRHFGIVIDAGSSGSRVQIYSWKNPAAISDDERERVAHTLPKVEKGTRDEESWSFKVEPGISSYADHPEDLAGYLRPLLNHARDEIPPSLHPDTPIFLLATAGMRLLTSEKQAEILKETCNFFRLHSHFKIDDPSDAGPCGNSIRIITGEEEGLFGWIAVNYLMDGFIGSNRTTYGFLDMGGASTQIAFEPSKAHETDSDTLIDVRLRLLGGEEIQHKVFVTTWLGYGTNQARERYVGMAINEFEESRSDSSDVVSDPCLPKNLELTESPVHLGSATEHAKETHRLVGTGDFEQCMKKTSTLLNKDKPCPDSPCLMNGVHVPPIDFSVSHFIGVSEYWFSSEHVFGLGGPYDFVQYERAAANFCAREWESIVQEHEESRNRRTGDGEVEGKDGRIVEVGKWGEQVEIPRLQMQCFKAAWIVNVLHEGIGMPRIVDPGGNATTDGEKVAEQAQSKGLGSPTFQSVDTVDDIAISWTLGKMVLEASKEVPLSKASDRPIVDPLDEIPDNFPIKPIRPFFDVLEDKITPMLPTTLHRSSLGFNPALLLFYMAVFFIVVLVACPLRRQLRTAFLRYIRSFTKRDAEAYAMEEGKFLNGNGLSSPTPTRKWLRRILPPSLRPSPRRFMRHNRPPILTISGSNFSPTDATPTRISPVRSHSLPSGGAGASGVVASSSASSIASRSSSPLPSPGLVDEFNLGSSSFARSRSASQMNLSSVMMPRSVSRVSSLHELHHEE
ncbi:Golgi apyrase [Stygiomarasmius scandens]|uniref:Golgi apyrase n=1 Tax=Marasmiellus scandens TaxID=2682957 RepID=A0ABR1JXP8_9AGAR